METRDFLPGLLLGIAAGALIGAFFLPRERVEDTTRRIVDKTLRLQRQAGEVAQEMRRLPGRLKKETAK